MRKPSLTSAKHGFKLVYQYCAWWWAIWSGHDAHHFKILIWSGIPDAQTKMSVSEKRFQWYKHKLLFSPMFTHYIGLVLAAHKGQQGWYSWQLSPSIGTPTKCVHWSDTINAVLHAAFMANSWVLMAELNVCIQG